jgi:hypothetical protein
MSTEIRAEHITAARAILLDETFDTVHGAFSIAAHLNPHLPRRGHHAARLGDEHSKHPAATSARCAACRGEQDCMRLTGRF